MSSNLATARKMARWLVDVQIPQADRRPVSDLTGQSLEKFKIWSEYSNVHIFATNLLGLKMAGG